MDWGDWEDKIIFGIGAVLVLFWLLAILKGWI
jgi:hypothetical protein